jgi:hypothetical protein
VSVLTRTQAVTALRSLGWRVRTTGEFVQVLKHFQGAWNLGPPLTVDGLLGAQTSAAIELSTQRRRAGQPDCRRISALGSSPAAAGRYTDCARIWVRRELVVALEWLRAEHYPGPGPSVGVPVQPAQQDGERCVAVHAQVRPCLRRSREGHPGDAGQSGEVLRDRVRPIG